MERKEKYNLLSAYCASVSELGDFEAAKLFQVGHARWRKKEACSTALHLLGQSFNKGLLSAYYVPDTLVPQHIAANQRWTPTLWKLHFSGTLNSHLHDSQSTGFLS